MSDHTELIAELRGWPVHGDDADHCGVCAGSCGGWPGEPVNTGSLVEAAHRAADALEQTVKERDAKRRSNKRLADNYVEAERDRQAQIARAESAEAERDALADRIKDALDAELQDVTDGFARAWMVRILSEGNPDE